jgi:uncharacterized protein (TIGR00730 family)
MRDPATWNDDQALLATPDPQAPVEKRGDEILVARVHAELEAGFSALSGVERAVSVFGSARAAPGDPDYELARAVAARLGREGCAVITGGGPGIMEAANRGAQEVGALSVGLTIDLPRSEPANRYLDLPVHFHYFFTRKVMFARYADAFVVFPGGYGTLDELFELLELSQTGKIPNLPLVLVRRSHWEPLLEWLRTDILGQGKISPQDLERFAVVDDVEDVCERVLARRI